MYQNVNQQKDYWDKEAENFEAIYSHQKSRFQNYLDRKLRWDIYERFEYTLRNSEPIENKTILDVGCGPGQYVFELIRRKAKKVVGIDIAPRMIEACRRKAEETGVADKCEFHVSDPFEYAPDRIFDLTIGIGLFDYIGDPLPVIRRMKELTRGKVILSFPKKGTPRAFLRKIRLRFRGCDVYFFSFPQIEKMLNEAGFKKFEWAEFGQLICVTAYCPED